MDHAPHGWAVQGWSGHERVVTRRRDCHRPGVPGMIATHDGGRSRRRVQPRPRTVRSIHARGRDDRARRRHTRDRPASARCSTRCGAPPSPAAPQPDVALHGGFGAERIAVMAKAQDARGGDRYEPRRHASPRGPGAVEGAPPRPAALGCRPRTHRRRRSSRGCGSGRRMASIRHGCSRLRSWTKATTRQSASSARASRSPRSIAARTGRRCAG